jgi:protein SCO1
MPPNLPKIAAVSATAATAGLLLAVFWMGSARDTDDLFADCRGGQVGGGSIGGAFALVDQTGKPVTDKEVFSKPALVYFGYTFCPDICPLDNARNAEVADILEEQGLEITPVFISIDPERDTPEVMADYAENMHPRMIGLTGTPEAVNAAARAFRVVAQKQPGGDPEYYLMNHTTLTYLMLPDEGFVDFFRRDTPAEAMADRAACFLNAKS